VEKNTLAGQRLLPALVRAGRSLARLPWESVLPLLLLPEM